MRSEIEASVPSQRAPVTFARGDSLSSNARFTFHKWQGVYLLLPITTRLNKCNSTVKGATVVRARLHQASSWRKGSAVNHS